jgi:hypothetical protein
VHQRREIEISYTQLVISVVSSLLAAVVIGFCLVAAPIRLTLGLILEGNGFVVILVVWALASTVAFFWLLHSCVTNLANGRSWRQERFEEAKPVPGPKEGAIVRSRDEL